jgi:hypothetical protein
VSLHYPDGKWTQSYDHEYDLIAPWKEPRKVSGKVEVVILEYRGGVHVAATAAGGNYWTSKVIARRVIEVELTEGEGL